MNRCDICKLKSNYNGIVCLVDFEFTFCKSHYLSFCRRWSKYKKEIKGLNNLTLFVTSPTYPRAVYKAEYQIQEWFCLDFVFRSLNQDVRNLKEK